MKISKLFHWLYAMLMLLPFMALAFNFVRIGLSGEMPITSFDDVMALIKFPNWTGISLTIRGVYEYMFGTLFGLTNTYNILSFLINALTYWTIVSIGYLIFDVFMYVPLLVHRWIDKARLE